MFRAHDQRICERQITERSYTCRINEPVIKHETNEEKNENSQREYKRITNILRIQNEKNT